MKHIITILAFVSGSAYAACDIALPPNTFYQCIERENMIEQQSRRLQRIEEQNKEILMHQRRYPNSTIPQSCFFDVSGVKRCF
jgi:hypothetical protein